MSGLQWLDVLGKVIVNIKHLIHPVGVRIQEVAALVGNMSKTIREGANQSWVIAQLEQL